MLFHRFLCWSAHTIIRMMPGIKYTFNNSIGETFENPAVIISNHQGHFDLMCILMMTPKLVVLTNDWVWHNPLYGWILRVAQFYPVTNGLEYNLEKLQSLIDRGYSVVVFPEGTRSADCEILRFHTGAFYLAEKLKVDILPVILHGVGHCIPKEDFMLRSGHMYLEVMKRIKVNPDGDAMYMRQLSKQVRRLYIDRFKELKLERQTAHYFKHYVEKKYAYKGIGTCSKVRRLLDANNCYSPIVDKPYTPGATLLIKDTPLGVAAWLMALVHEDCKVVAVIADDKELELLQSLPGRMSRLEFVNEYDVSKCDYVITI